MFLICDSELIFVKNWYFKAWQLLLCYTLVEFGFCGRRRYFRKPDEHPRFIDLSTSK